jgi:hypothetical protein
MAVVELQKVEQKATSDKKIEVPKPSIPMSSINIQSPGDAMHESIRLEAAQKNTDNFSSMNVGKYQSDAVQGKSIDMPSVAPLAPASILAPSPAAVQRIYEPIRQSSGDIEAEKKKAAENAKANAVVFDTLKPETTSGPSEPKIRMMSAGDDVGSRTKSVFSLIGAIICTIIALSNLSGNVDFVNFIFFVGFTFLTVYLMRQTIYHSAISKAVIRQINTAMPGRIMKIEIDLGIMKTIQVNQVKLTVSLNEVAAKQDSNKKNTTQTFLRYTRDVMLIKTPVVWAAQSYVTLTAWVELPKDAEGSFKSEYNQLAWTAELYGEIPGWYPDIKTQLPLQVLPIIERKPAPAEKKEFRLENLRGLNAAITIDAPVDINGRLTVPLGREILYTAIINPTNSGPHRKLFLEVTMLAKGAGATENKVIHRQILFGNGWEARQTLEKTGSFILPLQAVYSSNVDAGGILPISYTGKYLSIEWQVVIREEIPWEKHPTDFVTIIVTPAEKNNQGGK